MRLDEQKILVLGFGNMAFAMVKGLISQNVLKASQVTAVVHGEKSKENAGILGVNTVLSPDEAKKGVFNVVLVALKPAQVKEVLPLYKHLAGENVLFISVVTGVSVATFRELLSDNALIVRTMPNTPLAIGKGATGLFAPENIALPLKNVAKSLFEALGEAVWLEKEEHINVVTALSGSGPAYFFAMMEALVLAAERMGLSREQALPLILSTCEGAGAYALASHGEKTLEGLREAVTSKGGTTEAGLKVLSERHFPEILDETVKKAYERALEFSI